MLNLKTIVTFNQISETKYVSYFIKISSRNIMEIYVITNNIIIKYQVMFVIREYYV